MEGGLKGKNHSGVRCLAVSTCRHAVKASSKQDNTQDSNIRSFIFMCVRPVDDCGTVPLNKKIHLINKTESVAVNLIQYLLLLRLILSTHYI